MGKRILKIVAVAAALVLVGIVGAALWARGQIAGSLPQLEGRIAAPDLEAEVTVERDSLGIPTIHAGNRNDLAFATGFVHAQDRFFQMDLLRRNSAGELAELVGKGVLDQDRRMRVYRFRDVAQRVLAAGGDENLRLVEAYSKGVNAGLASLRTKPYEYLLLGISPAPWKPEDSALVMFSMYLDLQGRDFRDECRLGLLHDLMPQAMFDFLAPQGTEWDAPIDGQAFEVPSTPGPDVYDTRKSEQVTRHLLAPPGTLAAADHFQPGSNNWAVAGSQTADGRAMVANDMHLHIGVPHIWYRASLVWPALEENAPEHRITGATLPGTPAVCVGSNGRVAWGFTNSQCDWVDVVLVDVDPNDKDSYLTPAGPEKFKHDTEVIKIAGAPDETLDVVSTIWGPIVDRDHKDRPRAIRWVAHDTEGVNMGLLKVESAKTLEEAIQLANESGSPGQNFVVADDGGRIAWTIIGRLPRRVGFDGRLPSSWTDGTHRWDGYLQPDEYPRIIQPANGRIWTANARVVSGEMLAKVGDGGYDLGARAKQIRDDLLETEKATEADMLRIQLDDRAVFLERWRQLLLEVLSSEAVAADPRRGELRKYVEDWGGHAAVGSVGFRAVRGFRNALTVQLADVLTARCKAVDKNFSIAEIDRSEGPIWRLVSERPEHLIDPRYENWDKLLLAAVDQVVTDAQKDGRKLSAYTWGDFNTTRIQHPLSIALPMLSTWLDMVPQALPGDSENMPRIQTPHSGASQRMAVSPGHEADGYFHMPCGQSGHFMSPHYRDAHAAWENGTASPFLPGPPVHTLVLAPSK